MAWSSGDDTRILSLMDTSPARALGEEEAEEEVNLPALKGQEDGEGIEEKVLRVRGLVETCLLGRKGVSVMQFSEDSECLIVGCRDGTVARGRLGTGESVWRDGVGPVVLLNCARVGGTVALCRLGGKVEVREGHTLTLLWELPELDSAVTALSFHLEAPVLVVATCLQSRFYLLDIERRDLTEWSKDVGHQLPAELKTRRDCILGICFNPGAPNSLLLWGSGFVCHVDLDRPGGKAVVIVPRRGGPAARRDKRKGEERRMGKRRRDQTGIANGLDAVGERDWEGTGASGESMHTVGDDNAQGKSREGLRAGETGGKRASQKVGGNEGTLSRRGKSQCNFRMCYAYNGIIAIHPLQASELLLVEEPWMKIVNRLPDVLDRRRYGT